MSVSTDAATIADLDRTVDAVLAAVEDLTARDATAEVSDETTQRLLLAGIRLFAHKVDREYRSIRPVPETAIVNATEVAVAVTELMRVADLNMFDLAMWSGRTPPGEKG